MMKTKILIFSGLVSLLALISCRCDFPSEEQEDKDNKENRQVRYHDSENDSLLINK